MRYTDRQVQCLEAMGLVPWVKRHAVNSTEANTDATTLAPAESIASVEVPSRATSIRGSDINDPQFSGTGLAHRRLIADPAPVGSTPAPRVLVLIDTVDLSVSLSPTAAALLDAMLKAIDLDRRTTRWLHCVPGEAAQTGTAVSWLDAVKGVSLAIVLSPEITDSNTGSDNQIELPESGLRAYRLAHPERLLAQPTLKRQAWDILKAVRQDLA